MKEMMAKAKKDKEDANKRGEFPIDKKELEEATDIWKMGKLLADQKYKEKQGLIPKGEDGLEDENDIVGDEELQEKLFRDMEIQNMKEKAEHARLEKEGKLIAKGVPEKIDESEEPPVLEEVSQEQLKKENEAKTKAQKD